MDVRIKKTIIRTVFITLSFICSLYLIYNTEFKVPSDYGKIPFAFFVSFMFFLPIYSFIIRLLIGKFEFEFPAGLYFLSCSIYVFGLGISIYDHYSHLVIEYLNLNQENSLFLAIGNNFIKYYKAYDSLFGLLIFVLIFGFISYKFYKFVFREAWKRYTE